jgi:glutamate-ammonia-ligase adenylyltransferase
MTRSQADASLSNDPTSGSESMAAWMKSARLNNTESTRQAVERFANLGIPAELLSRWWQTLGDRMSNSMEPEANFARLSRFFVRVRSPQSMVALFDRDPSALPRLIEAFEVGEVVSEALIEDTESFELLRITDGRPTPPQALIDELQTEVESAHDERQVSRLLYRFHRRETIRIAFGLFARGISPETSFSQWSALTDAVLQSAYDFSLRKEVGKFGQPRQADGRPARGCMMAFGRLGAEQIGFETAIDCMLVAETNGRTDHSRSVTNIEFYDRVAGSTAELLKGDAEQPLLFELRFIKPSPFKTNQIVVDADSAFQHYDLRGRTYERQSFVQARTATGNGSLGQSFLDRLQPWVYRRFLGAPDIAGLGANQRNLQRRIAIEADHRGGGNQEGQAAVDIEQTVLFLQLLHGNSHPSLRVGKTFQALDQLRKHGLLRASEYEILLENYQRFRIAETKTALQTGCRVLHSEAGQRRELTEAFAATRRVIASRLEESFPESEPTSEETDLILDPQPTPEWSHRLLATHGFKKPKQAYIHLKEMSEEEVAVLSTRRCRYFLSLIAPKLLPSVHATPDPDKTLSNLAKLSSSLGGKGVLWELLANSPATMQLIVRMAAYSEYLVDLIVQSPGMIDDLMDSLSLSRLPRRDELEVTLAELCRQSEDTDRAFQAFRHSMHLRVGVRDILGRESIVDTHRALSDIAEILLQRILREEETSLIEQWGRPTLVDGSPAAHTVLALGKLGGQERNYNSDIGLVIVFEDDGMTVHSPKTRIAETTTVRHFFETNAQRLMRRCNRAGAAGKLFNVDVRFGPLGNSGVLAMQLKSFIEYFRERKASTIERLSLCKARPIWGPPAFAERAMKSITSTIGSLGFDEGDRRALSAHRASVHRSSSIHNIKRGKGGSMDVELLIQALQLLHAAAHPDILVPGTIEAIRLLEKHQVLSAPDAEQLRDGYVFLRQLEAALRLMNPTSRLDLPEVGCVASLGALLTGSESNEAVFCRVQEVRAAHSELIERFLHS